MDLTAMAEALRPLLGQVAIVFLRVGAMLALLPALGEAFVPLRVKLMAAVALTLAVAPAVIEAVPGAFTWMHVLSEAATGLLLGMGLRLLLLALATAGNIAAQCVSLSQMFSAAGAEPQPAVSNILSLAGMALFVLLGGLEATARLLVQSYALLPVGAWPEAEWLVGYGLGQVTSSFAFAFALAAPFMLSALLYNLALGAMNRAVPSLMVMMIGAPAQTLGGLILLALIAPWLVQIWGEHMLQLLVAPPSGG